VAALRATTYILGFDKRQKYKKKAIRNPKSDRLRLRSAIIPCWLNEAEATNGLGLLDSFFLLNYVQKPYSRTWLSEAQTIISLYQRVHYGALQ